jgi:hypothetical protein
VRVAGAAQVHMRSTDVLRMIQEHLCSLTKEVAPAGDAAARAKEAALRKALGKSLTAVLHKLEYQASVVCISLKLYSFSRFP